MAEQITHPELGPLSSEEIELIKKERNRRQQAIGWQLGAQACISLIKTELFNQDGTPKDGGALKPFHYYHRLWLELERVRDNPRTYG